jgi:hypothetical protein
MFLVLKSLILQGNSCRKVFRIVLLDKKYNKLFRNEEIDESTKKLPDRIP